MNYLTIDEETLTKLQSFSSVEEMNKHVAEHKNHDELSKTDRDILDAISRYACKYAGVCYLSKQKIAEAAGFTSRRTAIRACKRLENLSIIKQYETRRITGDRRQASNIIVIQASDFSKSNGEKNTQSTSETRQPVTPVSHTIEASFKSPSKAIKSQDTYLDTESIFKRGLKRQIPEELYDVLAPFFDSEKIYKIYGILLRARATVDPSFMIEDYADRYADAFCSVIRLFKLGKVNHLENYLFVTWLRLTTQIYRQRLHGMA